MRSMVASGYGWRPAVVEGIVPSILRCRPRVIVGRDAGLDP